MREYNSGSSSDTLGLNAYMTKLFGWMFLGLLVSFGTAFVTSRSQLILSMVMNRVGIFVLIGAELVLVFLISRNVTKYSYGKSAGLFMIYSILNGLTLSTIFIIYDAGTVSLAFIASSLLFGVMAIYGKITKKDLTSMGSVMFMLLIGLIIAYVVNMFLGNSTLDFILAAGGATIFAGLTAWDMQKLKQYYYSYGDSEALGSIAIMGALSLYLDFINIFLSLLRVFGGSRD